MAARADREDLRVWVRSGGRCVLCKAYLLESNLTLRPVPIGEIAHNVGRSRSSRSPRGLSDLPIEDRELAENKLLLCPNCHSQIDKLVQVDSFPEAWLRERKLNHEGEIRTLTDLIGQKRTVILRMQSSVRSAPVDVAASEVASAVVASGRAPSTLLSPDGVGIEIDLRPLAGEHAADSDYFAAAVRKIDELIERRLRPVVEKDGVQHLSVFAIARLPLLVYLGSRLDDAIPTDVYQRHRATESWTWPDSGPEVDFGWQTKNPRSQSEAILVINASGTIQPSELPDEISSLTRFTIEPTSGTAHPDTVATPATLTAFEAALRGLLAHMEKTYKQVRRLHVFAAAPVSVAVVLGRSIGWGIHPSLAIYERTNEATYKIGMEITPP